MELDENVIYDDRMKSYPDNTEMIEEISLFEDPYPFNGKIVDKMLLRSYRSKNKPDYSYLTIRAVFRDDVTTEYEYDRARDNGTSLETIKGWIIDSAGQSLMKKSKDVFKITSPPDLEELVQISHMMRLLG